MIYCVLWSYWELFPIEKFMAANDVWTTHAKNSDLMWEKKNECINHLSPLLYCTYVRFVHMLIYNSIILNGTVLLFFLVIDSKTFLLYHISFNACLSVSPIRFGKQDIREHSHTLGSLIHTAMSICCRCIECEWRTQSNGTNKYSDPNWVRLHRNSAAAQWNIMYIVFIYYTVYAYICDHIPNECVLMFELVFYYVRRLP